jgi:hypothetical protein
MFSGIFWIDDNCDTEELLYFYSKQELINANILSIKRSQRWLNKNIFWRKKYGYHIRRYIQFNHKMTREEEKKLRNSVKYWKKEGKYRINFDIFYEETQLYCKSSNEQLSSDIFNLIKSYLVNC